MARIQAPANVCSVQFSPTDSHTVAFGCANYRAYLYDLRAPAHPLAVVAGPQRAVSYVKFLGGSQLVTASTDSTLRCAALASACCGVGGSVGGWVECMWSGGGLAAEQYLAVLSRPTPSTLALD